MESLLSLNSYTWVPTNALTAHTLEFKAVLVGKEGHDGSPIYVGRTMYEGECMPCKVIPRHNVAYVSYDGKEVRVHSFELYCMSGPRLKWISASNGQVHPGAVQAGSSKFGESLYIGRAFYKGALTPGKIYPRHGCIYIPFGGQEVSLKSYEVMVMETD